MDNERAILWMADQFEELNCRRRCKRLLWRLMLDVTQLLQSIERGDTQAASELLPVSTFTISTPEFRIACSETMITSTALAKPSPCESVKSASPSRDAAPAEARLT